MENTKNTIAEKLTAFASNAKWAKNIHVNGDFANPKHYEDLWCAWWHSFATVYADVTNPFTCEKTIMHVCNITIRGDVETGEKFLFSVDQCSCCDLTFSRGICEFIRDQLIESLGKEHYYAREEYKNESEEIDRNMGRTK